MKTNALVALSISLLIVISACAPRVAGRLSVNDVNKKVHTLYIWDADGHTDLALLRGLKAEAGKQLSAAGYTVATDPDVAQAYVKVTVDDAMKEGSPSIMGRLYIVDSADQSIIYDKTCEARSGKEGYPFESFIGCALSEFVGATGKGN